MLFQRPDMNNEHAAALQMIDDGIAKALAAGVDARALSQRLDELSMRVLRNWSVTASIGY